MSEFDWLQLTARSFVAHARSAREKEAWCAAMQWVGETARQEASKLPGYITGMPALPDGDHEGGGFGDDDHASRGAGGNDAPSLDAQHEANALSVPRNQQRRGSQVLTLDATAPVLQRQDRSPTCASCGSKFSLLVRRHHCRLCGRVVCASCSPHRVYAGNARPVRACAPCIARRPSRRGARGTHAGGSDPNGGADSSGLGGNGGRGEGAMRNHRAGGRGDMSASDSESSDERDEQILKSILVLQRVAKRLRRRTVAATKIQAIARGRLERKRYAAIKALTLRLQALLRGKNARRFVFQAPEGIVPCAVHFLIDEISLLHRTMPVEWRHRFDLASSMARVSPPDFSVRRDYVQLGILGSHVCERQRHCILRYYYYYYCNSHFFQYMYFFNFCILITYLRCS